MLMPDSPQLIYVGRGRFKGAHQVAGRSLCLCTYMYLIMAYCFGAFTAIMVAGLLFLGWQHHREEARREKKSAETNSHGASGRGQITFGAIPSIL
jgi:hypothetical protein